MSIKVLTVEDSALIRKVINDIIIDIDGVELVGTAQDGRVALTKIAELQPDIITLDVEMPVMNGLETLEKLRDLSNTPVIMLSTHGDKETTIKALEIGAQDFLAKPEYITQNKESFKKELELRIKSLVNEQKQTGVISTNALSVKTNRKPRIEKVDAIVLGASTGGPKVLTSIICSLPSSLTVPVFVVQHMPAGFTTSFANRLNSLAKVPVIEAKDKTSIEAGKVYVAPGGKHMVLHNHHIRLLDSEKIHGVKPAVDPLFETVAKKYKQKTLGIVLTGMGKDGTIGCGAIQKAGGYVLAQDEASSVVYGMAKNAVESNLVDEVLKIDEMKKIINELVKD